MSYQVINPASLGAPKGWNNGMLAPAGGRLLFIAGQIAADASGRLRAEGFVEQFAEALKNVLTIVRDAGGEPSDIGQLTVFVTDRAAYLANLKPLGAAYRELMGRHYPAMALVEVNALVLDAALVEIKGIAVIADR